MGTGARTLAGFGATLLAVLGTAGACTIFNGLTTTGSLTPETGPVQDSAPPPDAPPPDASADAPDVSSADVGAPAPYLSLEQAARLCTLELSCPELTLSLNQSIGVPIDANNFSLCMTWAAGPIPATRLGFSLQQGVLACVADAGTCTGAGACGIYEALSASDPRLVACATTDGGDVDGGGYCADSQTAVFCTSGYAEHCQAEGYSPGSSCFVGEDHDPACALGPVDAACPVETTCITTFEDFCGIDNLHIRNNCLDLGDNCGLAEGGFVQCGQPCATVGTVTCDGNVVASCDGYEVSPFDCADMGGKCSSSQNTVYCSRPTDKCTPLDPDVNVCADTSISLCVGGQKTTFDCAQIGKNCVPGIVPATPHCG